MNDKFLMWIYFAVFAVFVVGTIFFVKTYDSDQTTDIPANWTEVEHCLVWGQVLDRATLMTLCVDFVNQDLKCEWYVQPDLSMVITEDNETTVLACTKKVTALQYVGEVDE